MAATGEFLYITTQAQASAGIQRVDFAVNGKAYRFIENEGDASLVMPANFSWKPAIQGVHTLTFTATDGEGTTSPPATLEVNVTKGSVPLETMPMDDATTAGDEDGTAGEASESIAGGGQPDVSASNGEENAGVDEPGEADDENDNGRNGGDDGGDVDDGNGDNGDGNQPEPQDDQPIVQLLDGSMRDGGGLHILVKVIAEDDRGIDTIVATIYDQEMETQFFACGGAPRCEQTVDYMLFSGERGLVVNAFDTAGQISNSELMQFQVAQGDGEQPPALVIDRDFDPREIELAEDAAEEERRGQLDDFGAPRITGYECGGNVVKIGVPYRYYSNNGRNVYAGGFAGEGGELIAAGWVPIEQGTNGLVQFDMEITDAAEAGAETESLTLQMMKEIGDAPFYSEQADLRISWPQPKPDLVITDVQRSQLCDEIYVTVENRGCADAESFSLASYLSTSRRNLEASYSTTIPAGDSTTATFSIPNPYPDSYTYGFSVVVDPDDIIDEIDEHNNVYGKSPIQIEYIHFNIIDILDTSDGEVTESSGKGEFRLYVTVNDVQEIRPSNDLSWVWKLGWGIHEIGGVVAPIKISPTVPLYGINNGVGIVVDLEEDDTFAPNDWDKAVDYLSGNINDPNSWKIESGERVLKSGKGRFQIHYIVYLNR